MKLPIFITNKNIFFFSVFLQRWWRCCLLKQSTINSSIEEGAVVCLQAAWRSYRERRKFLQWRDSAIIIQRSWRNCLCRRSLAALTIQSSWRGFRERKRYCQTYRAVTQLQAMSRAYLAQLRWVADDWVCGWGNFWDFLIQILYEIYYNCIVIFNKI